MHKYRRWTIPRTIRLLELPLKPKARESVHAEVITLQGSLDRVAGEGEQQLWTNARLAQAWLAVENTNDVRLMARTKRIIMESCLAYDRALDELAAGELVGEE